MLSVSRRIAVIAFAYIGGFGFAQSASGQPIYKWVDEKGVTHYSGTPPAQQRSKQIEVQPASPPSDKAQGKAAAENWQKKEHEFQQRRRDQEAREAQEESERRAVIAREAAETDKCAAAKARIGLLQTRGPVPTRNEKGEIEYWNWEQRRNELNELGKFVDDNCPPD